MKRPLVKRIFALCCMLGGLATCSPISFLNYTVPKSGYTLHKNIAYGTDPRQQLDIYVPDNLTKPAPVILFFYGGSWQFGSKEEYLFAGQALASKGFVTVVADYRLYPQVYFPAFVEDGAAALRWVHDHIGAYQGDTGNLFLAGHSAGAYIAVMLSANTSYLEKAGASPSWIKGTIGASGPYDFLPFSDPKIIALFSTAPGPQTQPITFVHAGMPPTFLATGDDDTTVSPKNTRHLAAKMESMHNSVEMKVYPGVTHIGIALSLARGFRSKSPLLEDITVFVHAHSGQK